MFMSLKCSEMFMSLKCSEMFMSLFLFMHNVKLHMRSRMCSRRTALKILCLCYLWTS